MSKGKSLQLELDVAAKDLKHKQKLELERLKKENFDQYAIKGSEEEWSNVLKTKGTKSLISVKSGEKRLNTSDTSELNFRERDGGKKKKKRFSK